MSWDAFQREVLGALGHTLFVPAPPRGMAVDAPASRGPAADVDAAPKLLRALARAAGVDVARLADLPPLNELRTPAAKRALWPRLRRLRRGTPP